MSKSTKREEVSFSLTILADGAARVTMSVGTYGKVGYRSAYTYLRSERMLGGSTGWTPEYSDGSEVSRVAGALGKDGEAFLVGMLSRFAKVDGMAPTDEERTADERHKQEAAESEERDRETA